MPPTRCPSAIRRVYARRSILVAWQKVLLVWRRLARTGLVRVQVWSLGDWQLVGRRLRVASLARGIQGPLRLALARGMQGPVQLARATRGPRRWQASSRRR